jgi:2-hydroxy-3-keto-5-methylthiopentenyl-1-phosphate phosphatase
MTKRKKFHSFILNNLIRKHDADRCYSGFGHDKSLEIRPYSALPDEQRPTMFYAGDGVSDLSAAKETNLLFAKEGHGT